MKLRKLFGVGVIFCFLLTLNVRLLRHSKKSNPPLSAKSALLELDPSIGVCDMYDLPLIRMWKRQARDVCEKNVSSFVCNSIVIPALPKPTRPHAYCMGKNVVVDFSLLLPRACPLFRPNYRCFETTNSYYTFQEGSIRLSCNNLMSKNSLLSLVSQDNMKDEMNGLKFNAGHEASLAEDGQTLFVVREVGESANLFHAMSDFFSAFVSLLIYDLDPDLVQVVILDEHPKSKLDDWWDLVMSRKRKTRHASEMLGQKVNFSQAVFPANGYGTLFLADLTSPSPCSQKTQLLSRFVDFAMSRSGFVRNARLCPQDNANVKVLLVVRRLGQGRTSMQRQFKNYKEIHESLSAVKGLNVTLVDFAELSFREQMQSVVENDILVSLHGASLTHLLWLPSHGGVLEIWPSKESYWRSYENMCNWLGLKYLPMYLKVRERY